MGGAVGVVPLEHRGDLPLVELHGEPMFLHPVRALLDSGRVDRVVLTCDAGDLARVAHLAGRSRLPLEVVAAATWWASPPSGSLVLTDPLCPLVPAAFVARVIEEAGQGAAAGYRPVTDTVKTVVDERIAGTLDRDRLAVLTSPVVVPGRLCRDETPPTHDFALLAAWLRARGGLSLVKAPSMARRVGDESAVRVLECLDELGRRVHEA